MAELLADLIFQQANKSPEYCALRFQEKALSYGALAEAVESVARALVNLGLGPGDRVAVYLPKCFECVMALFGAAAAGCVFVPVNPLLKQRQVQHILRDSGARVLITSPERMELLSESFQECPRLQWVLVTGSGSKDRPHEKSVEVLNWADALEGSSSEGCCHRRIDTDVVSILYTSGSTGTAKGVVLSHRNMVAGASSVARYLENRFDDRLLAVLPFSFDYGFSQLTTAFTVGAAVVLMEYLLPRDVIRAVSREGITGLAAVPPLWTQLAKLPWLEQAAQTLRYITNSGGTMPRSVTAALCQALPRTKIYLMYGLTEAFRSTYLPPAELPRRPNSIGIPIPNAEIDVVRPDGSPCAPGEHGELIHRGALVAMGYWNDPERTSERFRPAPNQLPEVPLREVAVWSGDTVYRDKDGFLYFVARKDGMIKTSGYRVSPTEVEDVLYASGFVLEAAALGIPHPALGQGIVAAVCPTPEYTEEALLDKCRMELPNFMVPLAVITFRTLPKNHNGKIDRPALAESFRGLFEEGSY